MGKQPTSHLDPVSTTREGVAVERRLELQATGIVAIETVSSSGETPVRVSVIDYLPGNWDVDEIGYHEEHAPEEGSVGSDSVVFEVVVDSANPARVVFGMVLAEAEDMEAITEAQESSLPRIDKIEAVEDAEGDDEPSFSDMDPAEFFEIAGTEAEDGADRVDEVPAADRGVLDELAAEFEAGDVDDDSLETVQNALVTPFGKSTRLRLRRLESRLEEFDVYVESLREMIDEHGTGAEFLEGVRSSIESVDAEVESLRSEVHQAAEERESIADELGRLSDVEGTVEELDGSVRSIETAIDDLEEDLDSIRSETESLRDRIEDWEAVRDRLVDALDVGVRD